MSHIYRKIGVRTRMFAGIWAMQQGISLTEAREHPAKCSLRIATPTARRLHSLFRTCCFRNTNPCSLRSNTGLFHCSVCVYESQSGFWQIDPINPPTSQGGTHYGYITPCRRRLWSQDRADGRSGASAFYASAHPAHRPLGRRGEKVQESEWKRWFAFSTMVVHTAVAIFSPRKKDRDDPIVY